MSIKYQFPLIPNEYIDVQKLQSCIVSNFGSSEWNVVYNKRKGRIIFLTTTGKVITNTYRFLTDEMKKRLLENSKRNNWSFDHNGVMLWSIIKYIKEMPKEYEEDIKKYFMKTPEGNLISSESNSFEMIIDSPCSVRDLTDDQLFYICIPRKLSGGFENRIDNHWKMQLSIMERVIQATKMCRITIETTDKNIDEVNIESFNIFSV